jgi:hypothetical protein
MMVMMIMVVMIVRVIGMVFHGLAPMFGGDRSRLAACDVVPV